MIAFKLHSLSTACDCEMCADCFRTAFKVKIKEKAVIEWTCPICNKPDSTDDLPMHFQSLETQVAIE